MTNKAYKNLEALKEWCVRNGYRENRWGHFEKTKSDGKVYRFKIQKNSVRWETKLVYGPDRYNSKSSTWVKLRGAFLKDLTFRDGKLGGMGVVGSQY